MKTTVHCIKHQMDLHALSTLYPVYCTVLSFEAWLHHEISYVMITSYGCVSNNMNIIISTALFAFNIQVFTINTKG